MSKRFPIPEFDRDQVKNLAWKAPTLLSDSEHARLLDAGHRGDASALGAYAVAVPSDTAQKYALVGPQLHAILCVVPKKSLQVVGRSWAWPVQRALIVDSLESQKSQVLADWVTPRPMSTRLGPQDGIDVMGGAFYVITTHRYGQTWIGNRTLTTCAADAQGGSLEVRSACGEDVNDFHACNVSVRWSS